LKNGQINNKKMKTIDVILKGGLKSCCSTYSADDLKNYTKSWFEDVPELKFDIIDIENDFYDTGILADTAFKHFGNAIFPLVYCNNQLIYIGRFPERNECLQIIDNPVPVTLEEIEEEARLVKEQQNNPK
jgi:hypothetical protein